MDSINETFDQKRMQAVFQNTDRIRVVSSLKIAILRLIWFWAKNDLYAIIIFKNGWPTVLVESFINTVHLLKNGDFFYPREKKHSAKM